MIHIDEAIAEERADEQRGEMGSGKSLKVK
jgi:hypothetical protein